MKRAWIALLLVILTACQAAGPAAIPSETSAATLAAASETPPPVQEPTQSPTEATLPTQTAPAPTQTEAAPPPESVPAFPDTAGYAWVKVLDGLNKPLLLTHAGDGSGRKFIVSQAGVIQIWKDGALLPEPFLDISERISPEALGNGYTERGLLGFAFHPDFSQNGYFFVDYTDLSGNTVVSRFQVSASADQADPQSELPILKVNQPYANHNGGMLAFGPDGTLYIGLGDGGSAGDPEGRAQALDTLLGKLLRIEVKEDGPYSIPADNPFAQGGGLPEIWAYGLRNPWRFSFDSVTDDLYIGDVGQNQWEEIDFQPAGSAGGANYGWDFREATHPYEGEPPAGASFVEPVAEYSHALGCSVSGGVVYRGMNLPAWQGVYFYGDYCSGRVWGLLRGPDGTWLNQALFETGVSISSFGQDEAGEIYLTALAQGELYQLQAK